MFICIICIMHREREIDAIIIQYTVPAISCYHSNMCMEMYALRTHTVLLSKVLF